MNRVDEQPGTRVLLPERPGRPSRHRRWWLLAVPVALLGLAVGLGLANGTGKVRQNDVKTRAGGQVSPASAQARTVAGVPVGYPDTPAGAAAAATNYAVAYGSAAMFSTPTRHAIIEAIADPAVVPGLQRQLDATFENVMTSFGLQPDGSAPRGETFVARTVPVGVRLVHYTAASAQVAVWSTGLIGLAGAGSTKPVAEAWTTATLTLRWADGDWKWVSFSQVDGPTPVSGMQPASGASSIASAVDAFAEPSYGR